MKTLLSQDPLEAWELQLVVALAARVHGAALPETTGQMSLWLSCLGSQVRAPVGKGLASGGPSRGPWGMPAVGLSGPADAASLWGAASLK